jgi:hypothetical protein
VQPLLSGPPLAASGLEKIVVSIDYEDRDNDYREHSEQVFTEPGPGEPLELRLRDVTLHSYRYLVRYVQLDGFERRVGPRTGTDSFLMVSSTPPVG